MSQPVQIPADVQRDDVLIGRLTARQLAALTVTAALVYGLWRLLGPGRVWWFAVAAAPVALLGAAMVFGRRDGMALDLLALAALRQWVALRPLPRSARPAVATGVDRRRTSGGRLPRRPIRVGPVLRGVHPVGSDGIGVLDLGSDGAAVVCAVAPVNLSLRSPREQDAVVAGFARWLHSLSGPVQILTRTQPLDLSGPVNALHRAAPRLGNDALAAAARGHAAHVAAMGEHSELLHHEFLIVFRDPTTLPNPSKAQQPASRRGVVATGRGAVAAEALRRRASEAAALLGPLGLRVTPLSAPQAEHVLQRATAPAAAAALPDVAPISIWGDPDPAEPATVELPIVSHRPGRSEGGWFDPGPVLVGSRRVGLGGS